MRKLVAQTPEVKAELLEHANQVADRARADLAGHRDTGASRIEVMQGDVDAHVVMNDTGKGAAISIEFDHIHNFTGRKVEGLYILHRAAGLL